MAVFTSEHTARKPYKCSRCGYPIKTGQRYEASVATPHDLDLGNTKWWRLRHHLTENDCYPETATATVTEAR